MTKIIADMLCVFSHNKIKHKACYFVSTGMVIMQKKKRVCVGENVNNADGNVNGADRK